MRRVAWGVYRIKNQVGSHLVWRYDSQSVRCCVVRSPGTMMSSPMSPDKVTSDWPPLDAPITRVNDGLELDGVAVDALEPLSADPFTHANDLPDTGEADGAPLTV